MCLDSMHDHLQNKLEIFDMLNFCKFSQKIHMKIEASKLMTK